MVKTRRQHASRGIGQNDEPGPSHGVASKKRKHCFDRIPFDEKKEGTRHRASPARLVKLNRSLSDDQKKLIWKHGFGHYNSDESSIIIPGRGSIEVSAESGHRFDMVKKVEENKEADDAFLRRWVVKLKKLKKWDWSQLIVDQLNSSVGKMDKCNSVTGCMFFLVVLYLDSLAIDSLDIPRCSPVLGAWTRKLVEAAVKLDTNRDGSFGKLKSGMFGCLADIQSFVSSKACLGTSDEKKRKISDAVTKACIGFTEVLGNLITDITLVDNTASASKERSSKDNGSQQKSPAVRSTECSDPSKCLRFVLVNQNQDDQGHQEQTPALDLPLLAGSPLDVTPQVSDASLAGWTDADNNTCKGNSDDKIDALEHRRKRLRLPVPEATTVVNLVSRVCDGAIGNTAVCRVDLVSPVIPQAADAGPSTVVHNLQYAAPNQMDWSEEKRKLIEERASSGLLRLKDCPDTVNYSTSNSHQKLMDLCNFASMKLNSLRGQKEAHEDAAAPTGNNKGSSNLATPPHVGFAIPKPAVAKDMYGNIIKSKSAEVVSKQRAAHKELQRSNSWDFEAPKCDIMSFVDEQMGGDKNCNKTPATSESKHPIFELSEKGTYSKCTLDGLSAEELQQLEEDAIRRIAECKIQNQDAMNQLGSRLNNSSTECAVQLTDSKIEPRSIASDLTTPTPVYQAPPRRAAATTAVLRSPYI
ncbi:hypothetical protein ACP4OV_001403 [Aristida adscensionis]